MVNASHARPLAAFSLLAVVAAIITGAGLQGDSSRTPARLTSPSATSSSPGPELVLGGILQARPDAALRDPLAPGLWGPDAAGTPTGGSVQVAPPSRPGTVHKARTTPSGGHQATSTQAKASGTPTASPTTSGGPGKGKAKGKAGQTTKATATAADPGKSNGKGKPADRGH